MIDPQNNTESVHKDILFEAAQNSSPLDFSARGLRGNVIEFRAQFTTSVKDVARILQAWKSMEETVAAIKEPTKQAEEQLLLPARQLAYPYKKVGIDDVAESFDVSTLNKMVTHVASILMGAEQKEPGSTE